MTYESRDMMLYKQILALRGLLQEKGIFTEEEFYDACEQAERFVNSQKGLAKQRQDAYDLTNPIEIMNKVKQAASEVI
jgi:hypothetical protein